MENRLVYKCVGCGEHVIPAPNMPKKCIICGGQIRPLPPKELREAMGL